MSVVPGFGGQKFIESALSTIKTARQHIIKRRLETEIIIDGGVDGSNAAAIVKAGADILVMGSGFFGSDDRTKLVEMVNEL